MNQKKSIEILQGQLAKLEDKKIYKDETWVFQTASYIKQFFGEQSDEYKYISYFTFLVVGHTGMTTEMWNNELNEKQRKAKNYIKDCIETIGHKGLYKDPKTNIVQNISNNTIWTIISISIPGLLGIGFLFGQFVTDTKNFELKHQVKLLQDSLSIRPTFIITNPKTDTGGKKRPDDTTNVKTVNKTTGRHNKKD